MAPLLLDRGADLEPGAENDNQFLAPLHLAFDHCQLEVVRLFLDRGANVDVKTHADATPLYYACHQGHVEMAQLLLARGADVNATKKLAGIETSPAAYSMRKWTF